jgi:hypothetical protein
MDRNRPHLPARNRRNHRPGEHGAARLAPAMSTVRPYRTWTPSTVPDTRARVPHQSGTS